MRKKSSGVCRRPFPARVLVGARALSACACAQSRMSRRRTVRFKNQSALIKPALLLEVAGHTTMGAAIGLAFAFLVTHIPELGIATLINYSLTPHAVMLMFVGTCTIGFSIGATLTGLAITLTEKSDT